MRTKTKVFHVLMGAIVLLATQVTRAGDRYDASCHYNGETISFDYDKEKFRSSKTVIDLKHLIYERCFGITSIAQANLLEVTVVARSKRSRGAAALEVADYLSPSFSLNRVPHCG